MLTSAVFPPSSPSPSILAAGDVAPVEHSALLMIPSWEGSSELIEWWADGAMCRLPMKNYVVALLSSLLTITSPPPHRFNKKFRGCIRISSDLIAV
jgi:hypothetical protein